MRVYWVSRHDLSPAQGQAIRDIHGADAEVVKDAVTFTTDGGLADYIRSHADGFVYAVAGQSHTLIACCNCLRFGVFVNHPEKRQDGQFGLAAVYHVGPEGSSVDPYIPVPCIRKVWENSDPAGDEGEALIPVVRRVNRPSVLSPIVQN